MLPSQPPDHDPTNGARGRPVPIGVDAAPPGEDGIGRAMMASANDLESTAQRLVDRPEGVNPPPDETPIDFLQLVREAEDQALMYVQQVNRKAWSQTLRAYHNEHYVGSKYTKPDWRGRSRLFVPKTRAAVRKDAASVAASLFNTVDAINCLPGNEADPKQRAAADVMEQLINYRTDRSSGKASFPWFMVAMGARQDAVLTGVCCTKQYWKQEYRKVKEERIMVEEDGVYVEKTRDVYTLDVDRPDMVLIPPENYIIDPSADWTDPAQSAAFFIIKWPMQIEEIRAKQRAPVAPWNDVPEEALRNSVESNKYDMAAIRRARELGLDRMDETQTGTTFQIVWVYEVFIRTEGEDWSFYSVGDKYFLTDPKPTREVYPEQFGERPISLGFASLESHRIYPMSPAESWQPLQMETNDLRNLMLDATRQNVMPVTKVRRGRQIDLDQVRRRSSGSSIIVTDHDDVTWENPPQLPQSAVLMSRELDLELDDLAGQQNYGSVETNNALGKTLGGLKLAAGAANAVQEYDIRVWMETWATRALTQIVHLEQYYEADPVVLGIAGQKAQLFTKYGINRIDDDLLEQDVTVRVSIGLGAGDPQQRLAKFQTAAQIVIPILQASPEFQSGQREVDVDAIIEEIFGGAGYKDGGSRFFKDNGQPRQNPAADLKTKELQARIAKDERTGQAQYFQGLAALARVALGKRELEADVVDRLLTHQSGAQQMGFDHASRQMDQHLAAMDYGHRHGMALADHRRQAEAQQQQAAGGGAEFERAAAVPRPAAPGMGPLGPSSAPPPPGPPPQGGGMPPQPGTGIPGIQPLPADVLTQLMATGKLEFTRGPDGRISGVKMPQGGGTGGSDYPLPQDSPQIRARQMAQQS